MPNSHGSLAVVDESQAHGNESDRTLVQAVVRAHAWVKLLTEGAHTSMESLAASIGMHPRVVRKSIRLAFLSPRIAEAILLGQQSKSVLARTLFHDAHSLSWIEQMRQFDLCAQRPQWTVKLMKMLLGIGTHDLHVMRVTTTGVKSLIVLRSLAAVCPGCAHCGLH
jgi:hypothetical protein